MQHASVQYHADTARDRATTDILIAGTHGLAHEYTVLDKHDNRARSTVTPREVQHSQFTRLGMPRDWGSMLRPRPTHAHRTYARVPSKHTLSDKRASVHPPELGQRLAQRAAQPQRVPSRPPTAAEGGQRSMPASTRSQLSGATINRKAATVLLMSTRRQRRSPRGNPHPGDRPRLSRSVLQMVA